MTPPASNTAQPCLFTSKSCLLKKVLIWLRKNILMRVFVFSLCSYVLQRSETSFRSKFRRSLAAPNGKTAKIVPSQPAREKNSGIKVREGNCDRIVYSVDLVLFFAGTRRGIHQRQFLDAAE